ncbi:hypothetical protein C5167_028397 [Papaver somniferum]|nr:hypothetical protein C5167_028397 [Papaver somniferum]
MCTKNFQKKNLNNEFGNKMEVIYVGLIVGKGGETIKSYRQDLEQISRSDPHINAFKDPYVFTATSSDVPLISETVGDDDYWSGIAQGDDEYSDVDDQELALVECADDEYSDGDA